MALKINQLNRLLKNQMLLIDIKKLLIHLIM
nr:MAG TPA: hypothetical protein [Caudoviricetes sp.]